MIFSFIKQNSPLDDARRRRLAMSSRETMLLLRLRVKVVGIDSRRRRRRRRRTFRERAKRNPVAQAPTEVEPLRSWGSRHGREQGHGRRRTPGFLHGRLRRSDGEGEAHFVIGFNQSIDRRRRRRIADLDWKNESRQPSERERKQRPTLQQPLRF